MAPRHVFEEQRTHDVFAGRRPDHDRVDPLTRANEELAQLSRP
jgi:hypothetical protein